MADPLQNYNPVRNALPSTAVLTAVAISSASTGDITIVAGVAGKVIRVWKIFFNIGAASNLTFKDGASTSLSGAMNFPANGGLVLDHDSEAWFTATSGNAFIINQSGTAQISGACYYTQVPG